MINIFNLFGFTKSKNNINKCKNNKNSITSITNINNKISPDIRTITNAINNSDFLDYNKKKLKNYLKNYIKLNSSKKPLINYINNLLFNDSRVSSNDILYICVIFDFKTKLEKLEKTIICVEDIEFTINDDGDENYCADKISFKKNELYNEDIYTATANYIPIIDENDIDNFVRIINKNLLILLLEFFG